jgi:hypothetical protein
MNRKKTIVKIGIVVVIALSVVAGVLIWQNSISEEWQNLSSEEWQVYERYEDINSILYVEVATGTREGVVFIVTEEERHGIAARSSLPSQRIM